jgi:hypothetical protein
VEWLRRGAVAVAVSRIGLGVVALTRPAVVARPWVGPSGESQAGRVLGRALGGRDLALGLGTLAALHSSAGPGIDQPAQSRAALSRAALSRPALSRPALSRPALSWVGLSGLADGFDLLITVGSWRTLPARERWLIALASGGAAALSLTAAAAAVRPGQQV